MPRMTQNLKPPQLCDSTQAWHSIHVTLLNSTVIYLETYLTQHLIYSVHAQALVTDPSPVSIAWGLYLLGGSSDASSLFSNTTVFGAANTIFGATAENFKHATGTYSRAQLHCICKHNTACGIMAHANLDDCLQCHFTTPGDGLANCTPRLTA